MKMHKDLKFSLGINVFGIFKWFSFGIMYKVSFAPR